MIHFLTFILSFLLSFQCIAPINNRGNIGQTFEDLASSNTVKSVAFAALTAGATQGLGNAAGLSGVSVPDMTIGQQATHIGINAGVSSTAQSLLYGEDFGSSLGKNLLTSTVAVAGAEVSSTIGGVYKDARATSTSGVQDAFNYTAHKLAHAGLGCAMGAAISGNCGAGAAGGALGEIAAEAYVTQQLKGGISLNEIAAIESGGMNIGKIAGAAGSMVAGGDAEDIYTGSSIGQNAAENNAVETLTDALMVLYDAGKIGYGYYVNDDGLIEEGFIDLAADGVALVVPFVPAGSTKLARAAKGMAEVADEVVDLEKAAAKADNLWTAKEVDGRKVYQRDDLIDPNRVDRSGKTNLERMQSGRAPIGSDGKPMELHHLTQQEVVGFTGNRGSVAEVEATFHQQNTSTLHINSGPSFRNDRVQQPDGSRVNVPSQQNRDFNQYRTDYWKNRANDFR